MSPRNAGKETEGKQDVKVKTVNPSGALVKKRSLLADILKETYEKCPGKGVPQQDVIKSLGLSMSDNVKITYAVKEAFPDTKTKRWYQ